MYTYDCRRHSPMFRIRIIRSNTCRIVQKDVVKHLCEVYSEHEVEQSRSLKLNAIKILSSNFMYLVKINAFIFKFRSTVIKFQAYCYI